MRRQTIVTTVECDICKAPLTDAVTWNVSIGKYAAGQPMVRQVELCDEHAKPLSDLYVHLRKLPTARPARQHADVVEKGQCPVCSKSTRSYGLGGHLKRFHGANVEQPKRCPDCKATPGGNSAMIAHRSSRHGYDYMAELLASIPKTGKAR